MKKSYNSIVKTLKQFNDSIYSIVLLRVKAHMSINTIVYN